MTMNPLNARMATLALRLLNVDLSDALALAQTCAATYPEHMVAPHLNVDVFTTELPDWVDRNATSWTTHSTLLHRLVCNIAADNPALGWLPTIHAINLLDVASSRGITSRHADDTFGHAWPTAVSVIHSRTHLTCSDWVRLTDLADSHRIRWPEIHADGAMLVPAWATLAPPLPAFAVAWETALVHCTTHHIPEHVAVVLLGHFTHHMARAYQLGLDNPARDAAQTVDATLRARLHNSRP